MYSNAHFPTSPVTDQMTVLTLEKDWQNILCNCFTKNKELKKIATLLLTLHNLIIPRTCTAENTQQR